MPLIALLMVAAIAATIVFLVRESTRRRREREDLRARHAGQPWQWHPDWAEGAIRDKPPASGVGCMWAFLTVWILLCVPILWLLSRRDRSPEFKLIAVLFAVFGAFFFFLLLYWTLRRRKYGVSLCRVDAIPIRLGATFHGEIETHVMERPADGFVVRLSSIRRVVTSSGRSTTVSEHILWQDEQNVGEGIPSAGGVRVPFSFTIPADALPTDETDASDRRLWRLIVEASTPGIDYAARFELPVFGTATSTSTPTPFRTTDADVRSWTPAPDSGITLAGDGVHIRPHRRSGDVIALVLFGIFFFGILAFMERFGVPWLFLGLFAVIGAFILSAAVGLLAGRFTVTADPSGLTIRRRWLLGSSTRTIPAAEVASIAPRIGMTMGEIAYHDVLVQTTDGRVAKAAAHLRRKRDADMLSAWLLRSLGR